MSSVSIESRIEGFPTRDEHQEETTDDLVIQRRVDAGGEVAEAATHISSMAVILLYDTPV